MRTANLPVCGFSRKRTSNGIAKFLASGPLGCGVLIGKMSWRGRFLRLWCDSAGSSLIEYSFIITIMIALVLIAVTTAGVWVANAWTHLLSVL